MTGVSTLVGDSLGAAVWLFTTATIEAAPTAPPTTMVAITVAIPESKGAPLTVAGHANSQRGDPARLRHRSSGGSTTAVATNADQAPAIATYQPAGTVRCTTSP